MKRSIRSVPLLALLACGLAAAGGWRTASAWNPQPDPPGFGLVGILNDETIRLNVVCYGHPLGAEQIPPPCRGQLMFHDVAGNVVAQRVVELEPGHAAHLDFQNSIAIIGDVAPGTNRMGVNPCIMPAPDSGRMLPSVEIIDSATGRTTRFINAAAPRVTFFARWFVDLANSLSIGQ